MRTVILIIGLIGFVSLSAGYPSCVNFTFSPKHSKKDTAHKVPPKTVLQKTQLQQTSEIHQEIPGAEWNALKVTYGRDGQGYFDLPWSVEEATDRGKWQKIDQDTKLNVDVFSQPQDPRLMLLFDKRGTIAGIRMAFLKHDVPRRAEEGGYVFEFDYDNNPMYEKGKYFGKDLWHTTVLLLSPNELGTGGRRNLNKDHHDVASGVYVKHNGEWTELSKDECKLNKEYVEGRCVAGMGKHYFYKLNHPDCQHQEPHWVLYDHGRLMGIGLAGYGTFTKNGITQNYYEHGVIPTTLDLLPLCFSDYTIFSIFSLDTIKRIMRQVPPCIEEYTEKFGVTMMHVFLKKDASTITCPPKDWHLDRCRS